MDVQVIVRVVKCNILQISLRLNHGYEVGRHFTISAVEEHVVHFHSSNNDLKSTLFAENVFELRVYYINEAEKVLNSIAYGIFLYAQYVFKL